VSCPDFPVLASSPCYVYVYILYMYWYAYVLQMYMYIFVHYKYIYINIRLSAVEADGCQVSRLLCSLQWLHSDCLGAPHDVGDLARYNPVCRQIQWAWWD
jgi:hypothetical protein